MSEPVPTFPSSADPPRREQLKDEAPETTADISTLTSDQSRVSAEELDYEDYLRTSFDYDKMGRKPICASKIIDNLPDEAVVLDAGCGTGNYMVALVDSGKLKSYIGIDINEGMLFHARKKARAIRENESIKTEVKTVAGSLLEPLPFEDNVFDMVIINQVLHHITDVRVFNKFHYIEKLFNEINRVLKPGGKISINTSTNEQVNSIWYVNSIPQAFEKYKQKNIEIDELKKLLLNAGFSDFTFTKDSEPAMGKEYWKYDKVFTETFRNGDSIWALVGREEFAQSMAKLKYALTEERDTFDRLANDTLERTGMSTQVFATKPL